jgi:hypothetical protein
VACSLKNEKNCSKMWKQYGSICCLMQRMLWNVENSSSTS